jgi:hypothetical protein
MALDQPAPDGRVAVDRNGKVEVALVALAISPVPPLLPMKEMKAGGRPASGNCLRDCFGELSRSALRRSHHSLAAVALRHRRPFCQVEQVAHRAVLNPRPPGS